MSFISNNIIWIYLKTYIYKFFAGSNGGVEQVAPSALKVINSKATFILKGLQALGNYTIMLSAQTIEGDGPLSLPIFCLTKPSGRKFYFRHYLIKISWNWNWIYQFWKFNFDFMNFHIGRCTTVTLPGFCISLVGFYFILSLERKNPLIILQKRKYKMVIYFYFHSAWKSWIPENYHQIPQFCDNILASSSQEFCTHYWLHFIY